MSVRLYFLGLPHCERDDKPIPLAAGKALALLAYLSASGRPQPRERVLGLLWAESSEEAARKNLRNILWAIRRALGDDVLDTHEDRLALAPGVWVDTVAFAASAALSPASNAASDPDFTALEAAVELYGGPFLDGLVLTEAAEFELWMMTERERLAQMHLRALGSLGDVYRNRGQWDRLIGIAERAIKQDNLQESSYRLLMEAYAARGERTEALHAYDQLRSALERELGVEPLPETEALRAAILDGRLTSVRAVGAAVRPVGGSRPAPTGAVPARGRRDAVAFVGRQAEFAALDAELARAAEGEARVVLVTGEIGIGKSTLWHEWSARFADDPSLAILETRCLEATQALPFAPIAQLFRSPRCIDAAFGPTSPVPPVWLSELARLLPEIRVAHPNLPAPARLPHDEERRHLFEAFTQCLLAFGSRRLVLFFDDAHWADSGTLDWLGYLVERLRDRPLLLAVAYRPIDASPALVRLAAGWGRIGVARRLQLSRLSEDEAAALIRTLKVPATRALEIHVRSAGNPYFLLELARATAGKDAADDGEPDALPPALTELLQARLARLSDSARQVLQAAAVLEPDFDFATLRRTSGRDEEETLDALDELLQANVLTENNNGSLYTFAHPLVGAVVREGLSGARRAFLYRRAAEALEANYAGRLQQVAGRLASAYAEAGRNATAARYAEMAAGEVLSLGATAEAAAFYRQALALEATASRHLGLGQVLFEAGDILAARSAFDAALSGFLEQDDRTGAARACLGLAGTFLPVGRPDEVLRWAERALTYLDTHAHPDVDPVAHAETHFLLGAGQAGTGKGLDQAEAQLVEAARLADEKGLPAIAARSRFELGNLLAQRADLPDAIAAYHEAIRLGRAAGDQQIQVLGRNNAAYHEMLAGDLASAHADIEAAVALNQEFGLALPRQYLYSTRGQIALAEQEWDVAEEWFSRSLTEARTQGNQEQVAGNLANLAQVAQGRGDLDGALVQLEVAREAAAPLTAAFLQAQLELRLAELYEHRGELNAAMKTLRQLEQRLAGTGYRGLEARAAELSQRLTRQTRAPRLR